MSTPESFEHDRAKLAGEIRRLRAVSGMSGVMVAQRLGWSQSKVSKIETGKVTPSLEDMRLLLDLYRAPQGVRKDLESRADGLNDRYRSLRMLRKRGLHRAQEDVDRKARRTTHTRVFQPTMIPGLLQTVEYARAVFSQPLSMTGTDVARAVQVRLDRQSVLFDTDRHFHFVVTEAALRWSMGGPGAMAAQADRMANVSTLANVRLGVLPWNVPVPQVPINAFTIRDENEVSVESFTTHRSITEPRDIGFYLEIFRLFADAAIYGDEARDFLVQLTREHA